MTYIRHFILATALFATLLFPAIMSASDQTPAPTQRELSIICLAKNIYHEARGQTMKGMAAVGWVTLNRANHPYFAKDVCDVVYARVKKGCQFSWVCEKAKPIREQDAFQRAVDIAIKIMDNKIKDPTRGALFFHRYDIAPNWAAEKQKVATIGDHIFYR